MTPVSVDVLVPDGFNEELDARHLTSLSPFERERRVIMWRSALWVFLVCLAFLAVPVLQVTPALAQSPVQWCNATPKPPWCNAVRGDRPSGWLPQGRSEVMARNGIVAISQPLAA